MKRKIKLAFFILPCLLVTLSLAVFNSYVTASSGTPLAIDDTSFKENWTEDMPYSAAKMIEGTVVVNQTFDGEPVGADPEGWNITEPQHGAFTVDNQTYYRGNASARFVDNSTAGSPCPYRTFPPQNCTLVVTFAIRPTANSGNHTTLIIYVDDGDFSGSNIYFTENGTIKCHDDNKSYLLGTYSADVWYEIKLIMNVPNSTYEIYIDDHLKARNVPFQKFDEHHKIRRIVFGEALVWQPTGYIDELVIRRGIKVPQDYPTIQRAIDVANFGDTIFVGSGVYYEYVSMRNKNGLRFIGEDKYTILDGKFRLEIMPVVSLEHSDNITVSGFTIRNGVGDGILITGSNNNITSNIISSNLGCGVQIEGEGNAGNIISGNVIEHNAIGVNCSAREGNTLYHNKFVCNDVQAIDEGSNEWDIGYSEQTPLRFGGNYWSDCRCMDVCYGYYQRDEGSDGIGDTPYRIDSDSVDKYPLYLIETVTLRTIVKEKPLKCEPISPSYHQRAMITIITTRDVRVNEAVLFFTYNSTWRNITMTISANNLSAIIPKQPYWTAGERTAVQCKVNASNVHGVWAPSATFNYTVTDTVKTRIMGVAWTPEKPFENESVTVTATVTEPPSASGVDEVLLSYTLDGDFWWETEMDYNASSQKATATIPKQPGGSEVKSFINASDKAGNEVSKKLEEKKKDYMYKVRYLPKLSTIDKETGDEIDSLDFEVMSVGFPKKRKRGKWVEIGKTMKFDIKNAGKGNLSWTIKEDCKWLSVNPDQGSTPRKDHPTETIKVTVKTGGLDPGNHVYELLVTSNGGNKTIYVYVKVRSVVVDHSFASADRCDVGSNQTVYFHAVWGHNALPVQNGTICINNKAYETDNEGWISFTCNCSEIGETTWKVTEVRCEYVCNDETYVIQSHKATAPDYPVKIIWDRVQITLKIADDRIDLDSEVNVTFTGVYAYYKIGQKPDPFEGVVELNNTQLRYSTVGRRSYSVKSISDPVYGLTNFTSNTVDCIWDSIRIIGGGVSQAKVCINESATVWFIAVYEYDCSLLDGTKGELNMTQTENNLTYRMNWSKYNLRWEYNCTCDAIGTKTFQVSGMNDSQCGLKSFDDAVGPLSITWLKRPPPPPDTGRLELSFTVDGKTPTENATYTVEYSDGTLYGIYRNITVTIPDMPVGLYHIICTYETQELSEDATIKEGENEVIFNFKMLPPPEEWWMWTIVYTIIGGVGLSQFLLLVRRRRARARTT